VSGIQTGDTGRAAYRDAVRPFVAIWLEDELSRRMYDTSIQVIGDLRADGDPALAATYAFFLAEAHRRRAKPGDDALADALYQESLALPDPPAAAYREHAMVLRNQGRSPEAAAAFEQYLRLQPQAQDAAFIRQYLDELETSP
jgi:tetratricopeptide (TPR) repeat protein